MQGGIAEHLSDPYTPENVGRLGPRRPAGRRNYRSFAQDAVGRSPRRRPPSSGGRSLPAWVRVAVAVPGRCVRLRHCGGGRLAVAYLYGQLGDRRDLGYFKRRSARDRGLGGGRILIAEVRE